MDFWEVLLSSAGGGAIVLIIREMSASYIKVIKGRHEVAKSHIEVIEQKESRERNVEHERTESYIRNLQKDYRELKQEFVQFRTETGRREEQCSEQIANLRRSNVALTIRLTKAEARIESYEEKFRELGVEFKPYSDGTKEHDSLPDNSNDT